jgi:hypothetical protein
MATTRNTDRLCYRYGICLNDNCEKCKSKEVQEIPARKDFVCQNPDCGKPLRECPPPKKGGNKKLLLALIATVIVLGGIALLIFSGGGKSKGAVEPMVAVVDSDSIRAVRLAEENRRLQDSLQAVADSLARVADETLIAEEQAKEKVQAAPAPKPTASAASGSKDLGYAVFKGTLKNGMPDDVNGRLVFKSSHLIDSRDPKSRVADAGDYVIGEFSEGHLVQGIWYGADNTVKGSIIIGK